MARDFLPSHKDHFDEEDYIDIEVSSFSYSSCPNSKVPSSQNREFEFQMASITNDKKSTTSHADELFYRGRLLPLHQKLFPLHQKLLQTDSFEEEDLEEEESFCINFLITPICSPSQSCRVSFELKPIEWSKIELTTSSSFIDNHNIRPKKLWSKLIKDSLISHKFKASRAFIKSLFRKTSGSNGNSCSSKELKVSKKNTPLKNTTNGSSSRLASIIKNIDRADGTRSFPAAEMKWNSPRNCLSSSSTKSSSTGGSFSSSNSCFNSNNGFYELNLTSDIEGSIEGAVAHCKKSQELTIPTTN
ncbi:probable membrane-associated kinase regulator 4 [Lycium barbarum]|uniref:probable membrane-associated kinase regulator 4 n=1 Tax=Lycium barbarum TaxID=112863 RepID=UPI00293E95F8|nr:probable membrane-associated kinase regulator 4 [Lycium barbarum]